MNIFNSHDVRNASKITELHIERHGQSRSIAEYLFGL